jgi:hypothetical protein
MSDKLQFVAGLSNKTLLQSDSRLLRVISWIRSLLVNKSVDDPRIHTKRHEGLLWISRTQREDPADDSQS